MQSLHALCAKFHIILCMKIMKIATVNSSLDIEL